MSDYDAIKATPPDSFAAIAAGALSGIHYKTYFFMLLIFYFVSTDLFIGTILAQVDGAVETKYPTTYGTFIQGIVLVLAMIVVNALVAHDIL